MPLNQQAEKVATVLTVVGNPECQQETWLPLRGPAPGPNPLRDISSPTVGSYKALPGSPHGTPPSPLTPGQTWCTVIFWKGLPQLGQPSSHTKLYP